MNHLDEGTIHAWLDGALDATQARDVETHVAQCETCASAVAEARGFVAGASRILVALDDVPGGVLPRRAVPPKREWRAARWVTGIAAALILAVGVTTWNRNAVKIQSQAERGVIASPAAAPVDSSPPASAGSHTTAPRHVTERPQASRPPRPAPSLGRAAAGAYVAARKVATPGPVTSADQLATTSTTSATSATSNAASAGQPVRASAEAAPPTAPAAPAAPSPSTFAGCYRTDASARGFTAKAAAAGSVAGGVAADARRTATRAQAPAATPSRAEYVAPVTPTTLRLDTTHHALGYSAYNAVSEAPVGSWQPVGTDSVRVDLRAAGMFTFARTDRVACP